MKPKLTNLTQHRINEIHRFFQKHSIPKMSAEKRQRILDRHEKEKKKEAI